MQLQVPDKLTRNQSTQDDFLTVRYIPMIQLPEQKKLCQTYDQAIIHCSSFRRQNISYYDL